MLELVFALMLSLPFLPFSYRYDCRRIHWIRAGAVAGFGALKRPEHVPLLADTACESNPEVRRASFSALLAILPNLTADHYIFFGLETVSNLCRVLNNGDEALSLAILKMLEEVGDGRALPAVERAADRAASPRVRIAAKRLIPVLQERKSREEASGTLLRGASGPTASPEQLLRAASAAPGATVPEQLLRATHQSDK